VLGICQGGKTALLAKFKPTASQLKTVITIGTDAQGTAPSNTTVKYTLPCGGGSINAMWQSAASMPSTPVCCDGAISNLMVRLPVALTGVQTWDFTLVKNGVDTALTVHFDVNTAAHPQGGQVAYDTAHSVPIADGETICWKSSPGGTANAQTNLQIGAVFVAASGQIGPLFTGWTGSASGTGYGTPGNLNSSLQAESSRRGYVPTAGTIKKLRINTNNAPGGTETRSVTLMVNGVDKLTATITGGATSAVATGNVPVQAGDLVQLRKDASAAVVSGLTLVGIDWNPATPGETILVAPSTGNFDSATTLFQNLNADFAVSIDLIKARANATCARSRRSCCPTAARNAATGAPARSRTIRAEPGRDI
jgi:hypothetical protein